VVLDLAVSTFRNSSADDDDGAVAPGFPNLEQQIER
jgi:hypothetical protein